MFKLFSKKKEIPAVKYQFTDRHNIDKRWKMIEPFLPEGPSWFLDIGTNNGNTQVRLAAKGHFALGLEVDRDSTSQNMPANTAVMITEVTPKTFSKMPKFDGIFMLSVFHRIWALQSPEQAIAIIAEAFKKADIIIFEGCSRHSRYTAGGTSSPPEFEDLNLEQSLKWHEETLRKAAPSSSITYIGSNDTIYTKDPRPLFLIRNKF
jgi:hypothetical protein